MGCCIHIYTLIDSLTLIQMDILDRCMGIFLSPEGQGKVQAMSLMSRLISNVKSSKMEFIIPLYISLFSIVTLERRIYLQKEGFTNDDLFA